MPTQTIKIAMDTSDVSSAGQQLISALAGQEAAIESFYRKMAVTNKEGEVTKAVFAGITTEGDKVEATLRKNGDAWDVLGTKVQKAASKIKEIKDAGAIAASSAKAGQVENTLGNGFNIGGSLPTGSLNTVDSAIQRIKDLVASGKVELASFQELFDKFTKNPKDLFPGIGTEEAKVVRALRTIQDAIDKTAAAREKAASNAQAAAAKEEAALKKVADAAQKKLEATARGQQAGEILGDKFDFTKLTTGSAATVESAIQRIKQVMSEGSVEVKRFQELIATVKTDPNKVIPDLTPQEQKLVNSLRTIQKELEKTSKSANDTKSPFITLSGILRLLEAQVLKRIFSVLENELLGSVSASEKFLLQIAEIRTVSQDAQLSTDQWGKSITALSDAFGKNRSDVAEATYQTLSNQVAHGAESFKFLETSLRFSQATVSSATDSVNLLSGALKSFQLPAGDAERVAAILFKTIELGRVRAKDMADTFGRVGTIAADAGVKIEEASAAIAVLTNRGIKFSDASTLIQNLLLKLIRPTDEMKKLFEQWGVASGAAAIATFGFQGVLQKLDAEARKGSGHFGELLGQIRAIRAGIGLTGGAFEDFNDALGKIKNSQESYNKAVKEVQESPATRAQQQITQLRNFFQQDFGEPFIKGMVRITEAVGGVVNVVKVLTVTIQVGAAGFIAYKVAVLASGASMVSWTALGLALSASANSMIASVAGASVAFGTLAFALAPFAAGFLIGNQLFGTFEKDLASFAERANQVTEAMKKVRSGIDDIEKRNLDETTEKTKSAYGKRIQTVLQFASNVIKLASSMKEGASKALQGTTEELKSSTGSYFDGLRRVVSGFNEEASKAKANIRQSLKESEDLNRRGQDKIFNEKLKYASPGYQDSGNGFIIGNQQIDLIKQRIKEVGDQAREEMAKGTTEGAQEARKLFNELQGLQTQLFDKEVEQQKKMFEFDIKTGRQQPTSYDSAGVPRYEFTVKTRDVEEQINKLTQERLELEDKFRKGQEQKQKQQEALADAEKDRIRRLQQQFLLLEKLDVFTKEGKLRTEFAGPDGTQKALAEFEERRKKILDLAGQDADPSKQFQVFLDLQKQRDALINQVRTAQASENAGKIQEGAVQDLKAVDNLATKAKEKVSDGVAEIDRLLGGVNRQIQLYKESVEKPVKVIGVFGDSVDAKSEPAREDALKKIKELESARDAFNAGEGRTVENANKVKAAVQAASEAILKYVQDRELGDPDKTVFKGDPRRTITDQSIISNSIADQLLQATQQVQAGNQAFKDANASLSLTETKLRAIPGALEAMSQAAAIAAPATQASFKSLAEAAEQYAEQLERINSALSNQPGVLPQLDAPQAPGKMFGGDMKYFAGGGPVGFVPRGSDQIPAMLGRDEFVMTGAATKAFKPLLQAMNSGMMMPHYMSQGGAVTNVGDITVNVSGGQTDEQSLRNIAQGLRRGIRRGTISLTK